MGRKVSKESNEKRSKTLSGRKRNKIWITNGESNKYWDADKELPENYHRGRSNMPSQFNGKTVDCRSTVRGSIPREGGESGEFNPRKSRFYSQLEIRTPLITYETYM